MNKIRTDEIKSRLVGYIKLVSNIGFEIEIKDSSSTYKVKNKNYWENHDSFINLTVYMILKALLFEFGKNNKIQKIILKVREDLSDDLQSSIDNSYKDMIHKIGGCKKGIKDKNKKGLFFPCNSIDNVLYAIKYSKLSLGHKDLESFLDRIALGIEICVMESKLLIFLHRIHDKHK